MMKQQMLGWAARSPALVQTTVNAFEVSGPIGILLKMD